MANKLYELIEWPKSQQYMNYDWFIKEAVPLDSSGDYLISQDRIREVANDPATNLLPEDSDG